MAIIKIFRGYYEINRPHNPNPREKYLDVKAREEWQARGKCIDYITMNYDDVKTKDIEISYVEIINEIEM